MSTGRPSALTPELQQRLCDAISAGNTRHDAAEYAGIGESTLRTWLAQGRRRRSAKFRALLQAVKKAEAHAVVRNVTMIQKAAATSWQAAAFHSARPVSFPEGMGRRLHCSP